MAYSVLDCQTACGFCVFLRRIKYRVAAFLAGWSRVFSEYQIRHSNDRMKLANKSGELIQSFECWPRTRVTVAVRTCFRRLACPTAATPTSANGQRPRANGQRPTANETIDQEPNDPRAFALLECHAAIKLWLGQQSMTARALACPGNAGRGQSTTASSATSCSRSHCTTASRWARACAFNTLASVRK